MTEKKREDSKGWKRNRRRSKDDVTGKARKEIVGTVIITDKGGKKGREAKAKEMKEKDGITKGDYGKQLETKAAE